MRSRAWRREAKSKKIKKRHTEYYYSWYGYGTSYKSSHFKFGSFLYFLVETRPYILANTNYVNPNRYYRYSKKRYYMRAVEKNKFYKIKSEELS